MNQKINVDLKTRKLANLKIQVNDNSIGNRSMKEHNC